MKELVQTGNIDAHLLRNYRIQVWITGQDGASEGSIVLGDISTSVAEGHQAQHSPGELASEQIKLAPPPWSTRRVSLGN
ncbi:MAG: hypothetical protein ABI440_09695 [Casimicrobiaceae bacterium]